MSFRRIVLELPEETCKLLETLSPKRRPDAVEFVLEMLASSAADGVRRPGSWERGWVAQAFGYDFEARLETDPAATWRQRVKR